MKNIDPPSTRIATWIQVLYIAGFILLTYTYNLLTGGDRNFVSSLAVGSCLVGFFYGYCYLVRSAFVAGKSRWSVPLLILTTAGLPLIAYALVYLILPWVGVVLYKPHIPFRLGEFLGKTIKSLIIPWVGVALYAAFYRRQLIERKNQELRVRYALSQQQLLEMITKQRESILLSHHFKNCLNSIVGRAEDFGDDYIPSLMPHLKRMLDYSMEGGDTPYLPVTIERELESLHELVDSLRLRLGHHNVVVIRQQGTPLGQPMPRLTLVTLFENVIKHGEVNLEKPAVVDIDVETNLFRFTCVNSINQATLPAEPSGRGLVLVELFLAQMQYAKGTLEHHIEADTFTICLTITYAS